MNMLNKRIRAFGYAFNGIYLAIKEDVPMKIHFSATFLVCFFAFYFNVSRVEWMFLLLSCALVIGSELVNSAIERMCDLMHPEKNEHVKFIKDVSAGAVLISLLFAIIVFILVFII